MSNDLRNNVKATISMDTPLLKIGGVDKTTALSQSTNQFSQDFGDGIANSFVITHGKSNSNYLPFIKKNSSNQIVGMQVSVDSTNINITVVGTPPTTNEFKVILLGK